MKQIYTSILTILVVIIFSQSAQSQIRISVPKIPKIPKVERETSTGNVPNPSNSSGAEAPNGQSWFSALAKFRRGWDPNRAVSDDRAVYISPYLACYAKKHGLDEGKVGSYFRQYDPTKPYGRDKILKEELSKLAELEREFKSMFPARPNNGKSIDDNPAIWDDILTNREQYYQCAVAELPSEGNCDRMSDGDRARLASHTDNVKELLNQVTNFTKDRGWYSSEQYEEFFMASISPKRRVEMQNSDKYGSFFKCFEPMLDKIKDEAKRTLPTYTLWSFNNKSPADERVMRSAINDLNNATVFKIGLGSPAWTLQKNVLGIPEKRFKQGAIWVKYPNVDHGYCQILWVNVIQEYAGGGTWGQSYGYFARNEPAGCPAGK